MHKVHKESDYSNYVLCFLREKLGELAYSLAMIELDQDAIKGWLSI
jgi:hypothetical protein